MKKDEDRELLELQTYCELQIKGMFKSTLDILEIMLGGKKSPGFGTMRSSILRNGNDAIRRVQKAFQEKREDFKDGE